MATKNARTIIRTKQVEDILSFLAKTPAPASLLLMASRAFGDAEHPGEFSDLRRVREKMQTLASVNYVSIETYSIGGRRPMNFYHLTRTGYSALFGVNPPDGFRKFFRRVADGSQPHMYDLAQLITKIVVDAATAGVAIRWCMPEDTYIIDAGTRKTKPDFSAVFAHSGVRANCFFERDRHSEELNSSSPNSVRSKITAYEAYYDLLIQRWRQGLIPGPRPRLRVPFWTDTMLRAEHILSLAAKLSCNPRRKLVYAVTMDSFLNERDALRQPIFIDHDGNFQALVNVHPSSPFPRDPIRLRGEVVEPTFGIC